MGTCPLSCNSALRARAAICNSSCLIRAWTAFVALAGIPAFKAHLPQSLCEDATGYMRVPGRAAALASSWRRTGRCGPFATCSPVMLSLRLIPSALDCHQEEFGHLLLNISDCTSAIVLRGSSDFSAALDASIVRSRKMSPAASRLENEMNLAPRRASLVSLAALLS